MSSVVIMVIAVWILVPVVIAVMIMITSMILMIVASVIFGRSNEIDASIAGMVLVTMLAPVLGMSRRHV